MGSDLSDADIATEEIETSDTDLGSTNTSFEDTNECYFGSDGTKWTEEIPQADSFNNASMDITTIIPEFLSSSFISGFTIYTLIYSNSF